MSCLRFGQFEIFVKVYVFLILFASGQKEFYVLPVDITVTHLPAGLFCGNAGYCHGYCIYVDHCKCIYFHSKICSL